MLNRDLNGKSRGYAFIEYENRAEFKRAFRDGHLIKINDRRVVVDCEYSRTNKTFRPLRLGGGLGNARKTVNCKYKQ